MQIKYLIVDDEEIGIAALAHYARKYSFLHKIPDSHHLDKKQPWMACNKSIANYHLCCR